MMDSERILINLILCGLLGLIGQGIRVIVGLKKLREEAETVATDEQNVKTVYNRQFDVRQLWLSLFIGFVAGCLASLAREEDKFGKDVQLAIIAAGYAGTDFIEGVSKKLFPGK